MLKTGITAIAAALLMAGPARAQSHQHGGTSADTTSAMKCAMHEGGADHATGPAHRYMPELLLKHASGLELTETQTAQLQQLQAAHHEHCQTTSAAVRASEAAAAELLSAESPDMKRYEALLREAANLKVDCRLDMASMAQAAKSLLTAAQREHITHVSHSAH
jgi:Spy/CpxP family protein refolding chaperone